MVAIAMIINATFVIPRLDHNSFWEDTRYKEVIFTKDVPQDAIIILRCSLQKQ